MNDSALVAVQRVRNVLRANTAFSVITGLAVAGSSAWLTQQLAGTPTLAVAAIVLGVAAFGIIVPSVSVAGARTVWRGGRLVAVADLGWVAISIPIVVIGDLTAAGVAVVAVVGACVLALAVAEVVALRQLSPFAASVDRSRLEPVRRSVDLAAPAAIGWEVVSDHELYGRLAPNLSAVHVLSDSDHEQRRCVARSGESWTESCDVFPDDRRYQVNVDTSDYPYPLVSMGGRVPGRRDRRAALPSIRGVSLRTAAHNTRGAARDWDANSVRGHHAAHHQRLGRRGPTSCRAPHLTDAVMNRTGVIQRCAAAWQRSDLETMFAIYDAEVAVHYGGSFRSPATITVEPLSSRCSLKLPVAAAARSSALTPSATSAGTARSSSARCSISTANA